MRSAKAVTSALASPVGLLINPDKKLELRPAGSDPRVGDGLVWNPLPKAFKYTFLDRMQRS